MKLPGPFRRYRDLTLTAKLFLLLLPLTLVPLVAVLAQWHFVAKRQVADELRTRLETRWSFVEQGIQGFIVRKSTRLREIADSPLIQDMFGYMEYGLREETANVQEKIREYFVRLTSEEDDKAIQRACLTGPSKGLLIKVVRGRAVRGVEGGMAPECPTPGAASPPVRMTVHGPDAEIRDRFLRLSVSLLDRWKRAWALLAFDVPFRELSELLQRLPLPEEGAGIILDGEGKVAACADTSRPAPLMGFCADKELLSRLSSDRVMEDARQSPQGGVAYGHVLFVGKLPIREGWRVALAVPLERHERNVRQLGWASLVAGFLFFGAAIAVLLPLARRATAPLRRLEEHARRISSGDFQQKLPDTISGNDEIGRLAGAFNAMVDSLAGRDLRLRQQAETLAARNEELTTMNRVVSRAGSTLRLDELLPALLDEILTSMGLTIGVIRLVDETSGELYLAAHRGLSEEYAKNPPRIPIGEEITGRVALTNEPILIPDIQNDPARARLLSRIRSDEPLRGFAAVPIVAQTQVIGVLAFGATMSRTFNQTDLSSLVSIGVGIGACIRNARLYQELSEAYERLRTLQDHLIRTEKLSAMGQLIAGVAHEISNPLTTILGYGQLLQASSDDPEVLEEIRTIIEQARRCARVVEKLLAFARETDKKVEVLDLHEVIGEVLEPARLNLVLRGIDLSDQRKRGLCFVSGDRYQLQQVFLNLLTNAQQAIEEQEPPRVIGIELEVKGDRCVATISDNGPGIRPEVLRRVFDPFFTTKEQGKGTGLGLSVSYGIAKDHGGEIAIESEAGKGTRVSVQLPRTSNTAPDKSADGAASPSAVWPGRKVLVIDDEPSICRLIEGAVRLLQVEVLTAGSVKEARSVIRSASPDLILSDIRLPDGDAFGILDGLGGTGEAYPGRLAFMSGDVVSNETRQGLEKSGAPCLQKPFEVKDIQRFVSECLQRLEDRPGLRR